MFNQRNNQIDDILNDCLERMLINSESLDDCLALYPQHADELKPLLQTAISARKALDITPSPGFRAKARYQFHSALKEASVKKRSRFFGWQMRWVSMVSLSLTLLLSGGGVVAAASSSMPDNPLYQVKLATEQVQLFLTTSPEGKAELHTKLADRRVSEIIYMAEEGNVSLIELTTERLGNHLSMIVSISNWDDSDVLFENISKPSATTITTTKEGGVTTETVADSSTEGMFDGTVLTPTIGIEETVTPPKATVLDPPGSGGGLASQVMQRSNSNSSALNDALESASEEVKAALIQAIEMLENGYDIASNATGKH